MNASASCANWKESIYNVEISESLCSNRDLSDDLLDLGHTCSAWMDRGLGWLGSLGVYHDREKKWQLVNKSKNSSTP
jgi:hypothetical protein